MKSLLSLALALAILSLCGCSSVSRIPPGALQHWDHSGAYGPFFDDAFSFDGVVKNEDGSLHVSVYHGHLKIMGFGPSDNIQGLEIDAVTAAAAKAAFTTGVNTPAPTTKP